MADTTDFLAPAQRSGKRRVWFIERMKLVDVWADYNPLTLEALQRQFECGVFFEVHIAALARFKRLGSEVVDLATGRAYDNLLEACVSDGVNIKSMRVFPWGDPAHRSAPVMWALHKGLIRP